MVCSTFGGKRINSLHFLRNKTQINDFFFSDDFILNGWLLLGIDNLGNIMEIKNLKLNKTYSTGKKPFISLMYQSLNETVKTYMFFFQSHQ